jgi:uncharacterized protein YeaO (DUF488 family)
MAGVGLLSACVPAVALLAILLIILAGTLGAWLAIQIAAIGDPSDRKKWITWKRKSKGSSTIWTNGSKSSSPWHYTARLLQDDERTIPMLLQPLVGDCSLAYCGARKECKDWKSCPRSQFVIKIKRVYDKAAASDGSRLLVDRIWPRGLKKADLALDDWIKEVAPSDRLRKWFAHDIRKWKELRKQYFAELRAKPEVWQPIMERAGRSDVTLLYGARDSEHNNAVALRDFLTAQLKKKNR